MAARVGADPYVGVGGRNGQRVDAFDLVRVGDALAFGVEIGKFSAQFFSAIPGWVSST